jgi:hypothetical protein
MDARRGPAFVPVSKIGVLFIGALEAGRNFESERPINQIVSRRFAKKQQMRWTKSGSHHLLQIRT